MISFDVTPAEMTVIGKIAQRAAKMAAKYRLKISALHFRMDLTACHANGCPLDLDRLLAADNFNFSHDVTGIYRHLDRDTGQLCDCFVPRFARPQS